MRGPSCSRERRRWLRRPARCGQTRAIHHIWPRPKPGRRAVLGNRRRRRGAQSSWRRNQRAAMAIALSRHRLRRRARPEAQRERRCHINGAHSSLSTYSFSARRWRVTRFGAVCMAINFIAAVKCHERNQRRASSTRARAHHHHENGIGGIGRILHRVGAGRASSLL